MQLRRSFKLEIKFPLWTYRQKALIEDAMLVRIETIAASPVVVLMNFRDVWLCHRWVVCPFQKRKRFDLEIDIAPSRKSGDNDSSSFCIVAPRNSSMKMSYANTKNGVLNRNWAGIRNFNNCLLVCFEAMNDLPLLIEQLNGSDVSFTCAPSVTNIFQICLWLRLVADASAFTHNFIRRNDHSQKPTFQPCGRSAQRRNLRRAVTNQNSGAVFFSEELNFSKYRFWNQLSPTASYFVDDVIKVSSEFPVLSHQELSHWERDSPYPLKSKILKIKPSGIQTRYLVGAQNWSLAFKSSCFKILISLMAKPKVFPETINWECRTGRDYSKLMGLSWPCYYLDS